MGSRSVLFGLIGGVENYYGGDWVEWLGGYGNVEAFADLCDLERFVGFVGEQVGAGYVAGKICRGGRCRWWATGRFRGRSCWGRLWSASSSWG